MAGVGPFALKVAGSMLPLKSFRLLHILWEPRLGSTPVYFVAIERCCQFDGLS